MFIQIAIIAIFKSYPTVGDVALYMAFFPVCFQISFYKDTVPVIPGPHLHDLL